MNTLNPLPQLTQQQKHYRLAFQSAKSIHEMLKIFKQMESCYPESELGIECWSISRELLKDNGDLQQVLSFGKRALKIFLSNDDNNIRSFGERVSTILSKNLTNGSTCTRYHGSGYFIASICNFLGSASFKLKRYNESLSYLNWADRNLTNLEKEGVEFRCSGDCLLHTLRWVHCDLVEVKSALGKRDDVVVHSKKILEINEKTLEEGCVELGNSNKMVCNSYIGVGNLKDAMPFALKALEIYMKNGVGDDTDELSQVRRNLGLMYKELGEYQKALEHFRLALIGLKRPFCRVNAQMDLGNMLIAVGKNEEGIEALKTLISNPETEGDHHTRALSLTCIAMGFCNMGKFTDARKYMRIAQKVLKKKQDPSFVATAFARMSTMYEMMKDNEASCLYLRKALAIPELPHHHLTDCSRRIFLLINENPKEQTGYSYVEEVVCRLKEKLGPEHSLVGYGYHTLGVCYMGSRKLETAAQCFERAKDVFGVSLGPHHMASLEAKRRLVLIYENMERIHQALEIQEQVVASLRGLGPSKREFLDSAVKLLNRLKEGVTKSPTNASSESKVCEDLAATISKCGMSDSGKEVK